MNSPRVVCTTALHLIGRTPARTAVVAATIAVPTAAAAAASVAGWNTNQGLPIGAVAVIVAILVVAQASPEPTSLASSRGWRGAGASARAAGRPQRIALCLVGWASVIGAIAPGALLGGLLADAQPHWRRAWLLAVGLIAVVPVSVALVRQRENSSGPPEMPRRAHVFVGLVVAASAGTLAAAAASGVRTDFDLTLIFPVATVLTAIAVTSLLGPLRTAVMLFAGRFARWRAVVTIATRHRTRFLVRAVAVAALVVAAGVTTVGSSVASRADRLRSVIGEFRQIPVVPPNVMALTLPAQAANPFGTSVVLPTGPRSTSGFSLTTVAQVARRFPDSEVVPLMHVANPSSELPVICLDRLGCDLPVVVADPRLAAVYQPTAPATHISLLTLTSPPRTVDATQSFPRVSASARARLSGKPLPMASWQNVNYLQIDRAAIAGTQFTTSLRTIFVTRNTPYSASERQALRALARDPNVIDQPFAAAVTSDQRTGGLGVDSFVGAAPWAATAASAQWSIAGLAAVLALLVVVGTGTVDALDRRLDNRRLERLGATPSQLRQAAALYTGMELGLAALVVALSVAGLVAFGVHQYSTRSAGIPVAYVLPVPQLAFLVLGMPAIGAAIGAAVACPKRPYT